MGVRRMFGIKLTAAEKRELLIMADERQVSMASLIRGLIRNAAIEASEFRSLSPQQKILAGLDEMSARLAEAEGATDEQTE